MRHGRSKAARRTLQFFRRTIDLSPPYHVILDGTFLAAVVRYKLQDEIRDRIAKLLQLDPSHSQQIQHQPHNSSHRAGNSQQNQQQLYCHVPRSSLQELENLLTSLQEKSKSPKGETKEQLELLDRARQWGLDESDEVLETLATQSEETNEPPPTPKVTKGGRRQKSQESAEASLSTAAQDILRFVEEQQGTSSPNHGADQGSARGGKSSKIRRSRIYLVASQDEQLLHHLRRVGRVPCLHLARGGVLLLESPSNVAVDMAQREESAKWNAKEESLGFADESSNNDGESSFHQTSQQQQQTRVLKRKARGPNPLSCKKKKVETPKQQRPTTTKPTATTSNDGSSSAKSSRRRRRKTSGSGEPKSDSTSVVES